MTAGMLQDLGHSVTEVASGAEALAMLKDDPAAFDLVVSDYAMPHLSGMEVVRLAREARPDMPALLITGYADADAIGERPDDLSLLQKPFNMPALAAAVRRAGEVDMG